MRIKTAIGITALAAASVLAGAGTAAADEPSLANVPNCPIPDEVDLATNMPKFELINQPFTLVLDTHAGHICRPGIHD